MTSKQIKAILDQHKMLETPWKYHDFSGINACNINTNGKTFSITDTNKERCIASTEAVISAVNATWGKGIDPTKVEQFIKAVANLFDKGLVIGESSDFHNDAKQLLEDIKL